MYQILTFLSLVKNILYIHIPILEKTNIHYMALKLERKKNYS